jgi:glutamate synthase (NADPH/NADH) small chain
MGKPTGFLEWGRQDASKRSKSARIRDWRELTDLRSPDQSRQQAGRCMDCGVPFCHQGCPLGNEIPDWNDLVYRDRWRDAYLRLAGTNDFPELTGRLCPAPCEGACVLAIDQAPVTIEQIEREIIERAFAEGWVVPSPPPARTGKSVGVVGSGPAGLAAAAQLNRAGHRVTVYEKQDRLGGLCRYGIPDFKLEKRVLDRRLAILAEEGVGFQTGVEVGRGVSWGELRSRHDALFLGFGAARPRELEVPGRDLDGVVLAMDYLERQNRRVAGEAIGPEEARQKRVIILGGGDTGSDCLGTAHRQGAAEVRQIELLPAPPPERAPDNPWPQWPLVFRTSSSQEEGGERGFGFMTARLEGEGRALARLCGHEVRSGEAGRLVPVAGTERALEVDLLVLALGFLGPAADPGLEAELGVRLDARGVVAVDQAYMTTVPGVFAGGDAKRGASLIVWAIAEGREAACAIDRWLMGGLSGLPTRGANRPFGGRGSN